MADDRHFEHFFPYISCRSSDCDEI